MDDPFRIRSVTVRRIRMTLRTPFRTSFGVIHDRESMILEVRDEEGLVGYGECVAFSNPWYTEETQQTALHMLRDFFVPLAMREPWRHPDEAAERFASVRGNPMARSALEGALWDLYARRKGISLSRSVGGVRERIEVGVSIGMLPESELLRTVEQYVGEGYRRIKVKIQAGEERRILSVLRRRFVEAPLMADGNSAYTLDDRDLLLSLDEFDLMMLEQPLGETDFLDHARLQETLRTPLCLDESIANLESVRVAIALRSCQVINVKLGRVGGFHEARRIHDLCQQNQIAAWCGGMLETGISRAHTIALASLPGFSIPGDISASSRYWERDLINPAVTVENGEIVVPTKPGLGYTIDHEYLQHVTQERLVFS